MRRLFIVACLLLAVLLPLDAFSEDATPKKETPKGPVLPIPYGQGPVAVVDAEKMTLEVVTGITGMMGRTPVGRVFSVTADTTISKGGKPAKLADIAQGNYVRLHYKKDGEKSIAREILVLEKAPQMEAGRCRGVVTAMDPSGTAIEIKDADGNKLVVVLGDGLIIGNDNELAVGKYARITYHTDETGVIIARKMLVNDEAPAAPAKDAAPIPEEKK